MFAWLVTRFSRHSLFSISILGFCFVSFGAVSMLIGYRLAVHQQPSRGIESRSGGYDFINPLLECELAPESGFKVLQPIQNHVSSIVGSYLQLDGVEDVSVYFRDLNNGPWFGIDEQKLFAPASLFKVPLAIAILKEAQSNPELLQQSLFFETRQMDEVASPNFTSSKTLELGHSYTIDELIERMIAYSDNEAMSLLYQYLDPKLLSQVESDLDLGLQTSGDGEKSLSVKAYAGIFRVLYNASYLNREMSDKLLRTLAKSEFTSGIVRPLPPNTVVAHKFGERGIANLNGTFSSQLHDCGIVYNYENPYLLCVMTRGSDFKKQTELIRAVSKSIYEDLSK